MANSVWSIWEFTGEFRFGTMFDNSIEVVRATLNT